jgi:trigger factor
LLGLSAGEEKSFTVTYPEDFSNEKYAGKEVTFEVKVSSVKAKEVDDLDDEFAKTVSDFDTLEALRADIKENIRRQRENERDHELGNKALDQVVEAAKIEWPLAFEEETLEQEMNRLTRDMENYGISIDNYLQIQKQSREEFMESLRDRVTERMQRTLAMGKIAELEGLKVSESEILERAKLIADMSGRGDQLWRNILASEAQQSIIANDLLVDKVIHWLSATARGEEPTAEPEEEEEAVSAEAETAEVEAETGEAEVDSPAVEADQAAEVEADAETDQDKSESAEEPATTQV